MKKRIKREALAYLASAFKTSDFEAAMPLMYGYPQIYVTHVRENKGQKAALILYNLDGRSKWARLHREFHPKYNEA